MDIYLIRHTEVAVSRSVAYGQSDVDLTDTYDEQYGRLRQHLPDEPVALFSSPLSRCSRLAEDLAASLESPGVDSPGRSTVVGLPHHRHSGAVESPGVDAHRSAVQYDDRLKEFHFGDWELTPWAEIGRDVLDPWMADFVSVRTPNGENFGDVFERVGGFWREQILPVAETGASRPVFIVSHGGVIRALLCLFLDLPLQNAYRINLDYGAVTKLTLTGGSYTIHYINR